MKSYLNLITISAAVRKRQNRMTILCIALAVFLVTSIFSMADMAIRMEKENEILTYGHWHIGVKRISEETASNIAKEPTVATISYYDPINYKIDKDYYVNGKKAAVVGAEQAYFTDIMTGMPITGEYPIQADEVILTNYAERVLGLAIGDTFTLQTPDKNLSLRVSGFVPDSGSMKYDAVVVFLDKEAFQQSFGITETDNMYYVRLQERGNLRKAIENLKASYQLSDEQIGENGALLGAMGYSANSYIIGLYGIAAFLFILILLAGVFMITGSMNSNVAGRTQFFGMLRCIGASKTQVIRFVRLEALNWCRVGIPFGIFIGIGTTWALCMALRFGIGGEFAAMPLFGVSPIGIISGGVIGVITVLCAARTPARRAASVSPITAASGNAYIQNVRKKPGRVTAFLLRYFHVDIALGIQHAVSSPKNLLLMTGSFALSIIMFLSFSILPIWVKHALHPLRPDAPDVYIATQNNSNSLKNTLIPELERQTNVKKVFGRMSVSSLPVRSEQTAAVDLISYGEQQMAWAKADVLEGDIETVKTNVGSVITVYQENAPLALGDTLKVNGVMLTITCILSNSPFQADETPTVICSEETFSHITGENGYCVIDIQLENTATDADVNALRTIAGEENVFSDRRESNREIKGTYLAFSLVIYGFLGLIGLITAFYIINSVSMSASAKLRQYGVMRAVGMDRCQLVKIIAAESLTDMVLGCTVGILFGLPLHKILCKVMITNYFQTAWQAPWLSIGIIFFLAAVSAIVAIYAPAKRICNIAITETINEL